MPADLRDAPPAPEAVPLDARRHARRGALLLAVAAWNVWVWVTRVMILLDDPTPRTGGFIAVHALLYGTSFLLALVIGAVGWRMWREGRATREHPA